MLAVGSSGIVTRVWPPSVIVPEACPLSPLLDACAVKLPTSSGESSNLPSSPFSGPVWPDIESDTGPLRMLTDTDAPLTGVPLALVTVTSNAPCGISTTFAVTVSPLVVNVPVVVPTPRVPGSVTLTVNAANGRKSNAYPPSLSVAVQ